jgi:hypothetical protein
MIGSFVGALIALAARVADRIEKRDKREEARDLRPMVEALAHSRAQLIDHIELLERELATERHMSAHWLGEAQRLIRERRQQEAVLANADLNRAMAQQNMALYQQQALAQQSQQAQFTNALAQAQNQQAFANEHWCNCVPSRAQVWGASHGLVNQLNRGDE